MPAPLVAGTFGLDLRRRQLPNLFEILLHVLLIGQRDFVAIDLASGFGVLGCALRVLGLQLLLAGGDFHHYFSGHVLRALADNLADLAHRGQFRRLARGFVAILLADAALAVRRVGLIRTLAFALALRRLLRAVLRLLIALRLSAGVAIGLLLALRLRRIRFGALALLLAGLRYSLRPGAALPAVVLVGFQLGKQIRQSVAHLFAEVRIFASAARLAGILHASLFFIVLRIALGRIAIPRVTSGL